MARKHEIVIIDHDEDDEPPPQVAPHVAPPYAANTIIVIDDDDDDEPLPQKSKKSRSAKKPEPPPPPPSSNNNKSKKSRKAKDESPPRSSKKSRKNAREVDVVDEADEGGVDGEIDYKFTASKPLSEATLDVRAQGCMTVSNVFSAHILKMLTQGKMKNVSLYGRKTDTWTGVVNEFNKNMTFDGRGNVKTTSSEVTVRGGRYDMKMHNWIVQELHLEDILECLLRVLRDIMCAKPKPQIRTHNFVYVPKHSHEDQTWHMDYRENKSSKHNYFTILIHLNPIGEKGGGTEYINVKGKREIVRAKPGDAFVFHGALEHRGLANRGDTDRYFYYASFSCHADKNEP